MIRIAILLSLLTVTFGYPRNLEWLFGINKKTNPKEERSVCTSNECKIIAEVIKRSMNSSIDPCEDFYEYACGNWANHNPIPQNRTSWSLWDMTERNVENKIKELLDKKAKADDILAVRLAKKWFNSCMDTERLEQTGLDPLLSTLSRHGGWPLIMESDEWDDMFYTWQKVDDYYARLTGYNAFHDVEVILIDWGVTVTAMDIPLLPPNSYKLISGEDDDEEEETEGHSQEEGSEERNENNEDDEDNENKTEDETDNDDEESEEESKKKLQLKKIFRKRYNKGLGNAKTKSNKAHKILKKHHTGKKMKKRVKRRTRKTRLQSNKQRKQQHVKKHKIIHHTMKNKAKLSKLHKKVSVATHTKTSMKKNTVEDGGKDENDKTNESNNGSDNTSKVDKDDSIDTDENENSEDDDQNYSDDSDDNEDSGNSESEKDSDDSEYSEDSEDNEDSGDSEDNDEYDDSEDSEDSDDSDDDSDEVDVTVVREKYAEYIKKVALALANARGVKLSEKRLRKDIEDMVEFQAKLAEITRSRWKIRNLTLSEFQEMYDSFKPTTANGKVNWIGKVKKLFNEAGKEVDGDLDLMIDFEKYMKKLRALLDTTSSVTIVNYVHWNSISRLVKATTQEMRDLFHSLYDDDDREVMTRSEECAKEVKMSEIVAYDYIRQYFSDDTVKLGMDMIDDIQKEVEYQVKESEWLDAETKDFILDKLVNMEKLVGYPDWYRNSTALKQFYKGVVIGPSYYENTLSYLRYSKRTSLTRTEDDEDDLWLIDPLVLNAYFLPSKNSITITAADFESPFFAYERPQGINFGIIGFIMAHEVNHGFDDSGHLYSKEGKLSEWLSTMAVAYNKRAECFVDQFNNYSILKSKNVKIKNYGNMTAGENIADTMGLQAVYRAYQRRQRECRVTEPALPGLENFSNDQLFFLSFANLWCEAVDPKTARRRAKYDVHSPGRLRTIGSVSNSEDFARAYKCPIGSPMNPEKKCNIWK